MLGEGVYLSRDVAKAAHYPLDVDDDDLEGRVILECLVNVGKVKKIDSLGHPMQQTWAILGYDTAWVPPHCGMVPSGLEEDCVWNPERIVVLRRVAVAAAAAKAADRKAQAEQSRREQARRSEAKQKALVAAVSKGRGNAVESTSVNHSSPQRGRASKSGKKQPAVGSPSPGRGGGVSRV